ncbi:glycosyltransferase family 4 protein [Lentzea californiensis]|uniref:glycosyltransferase family 4 protein n=1 Tax=Lentzea californiensis TaxID=438851 RepID=UPI002164B1D3|nr:glycosyltransferase family 4 protein [Lentzea californiensis]MCR3747129.1 Glycosyl transferases group 1 [Lentzea californiensis]
MNTVACTITTESGLPAATVLARSYLAHHRGGRFVVAVLDAEPGTRTQNGITFLGPDSLGLTHDDFLGLATAYPPEQLAEAVKPFLLGHLLVEAEVAVHLTASSYVLAPMHDVLSGDHALVVAPHSLRPIENAKSDEYRLIGTGVFDPGFVVVSLGAADFLQHWVSAVREFRTVDPNRSVFAEQAWFDQAVSQHPHHVTHTTIGVWNAFERQVDEHTQVVDLVGFDPTRPWLLSTHLADKPLTLLSARPDLRAVTTAYAEALLDSGYIVPEDVPASWLSELTDGTPITPLVRGMYRQAVTNGDAVPHAFSGKDFRDWLTARQAGALNRWAAAVWDNRPDLRVYYENNPAHPGFLEWLRVFGVPEKVMPSWAIPTPPPPVAPACDELGVNLLGHLTAVLGVGELGRALHDALDAAGLPTASVVEDELIVNELGIAEPADVGTPRFPVSVLCVNADLTRAVISRHPEVAEGRHKIGVWSWELDEFPEAMHEYGCLDEIWTISEFCREAIAAHTDKPVKVFPIPIAEREAISRKPGGRTRFLFAMDFNSVFRRKNPLGTIEAFRRAFPGRDDVELVLKVINGKQHVPAAERLRAAVAGDDRVTLIERYLSVEELHELYESSDCYVSLHRSEGFGFTVAEAMSMGIPVISTDYSGTAEFLDPVNCWPVPYEIVEVGPDAAPYPPGARWAEPDLDAAAQAMREVADDPARAAERGLAAREHLHRTRSTEAAAKWIEDQVGDALQAWRKRSHPAPPVVVEPEPAPGVTPVLRKAILRVVSQVERYRSSGPKVR